MNKHLLVLIPCLFFFIPTNFAQQIFCGYDIATQGMAERYPSYQTAVQKTFEAAKRLGKEARVQRSMEVYTIPTVVHVVWKEGEENIPDSLIHSQIEVLNEDYRRLNANASDIRPIFEDVVGDPMVEFELVDIVRVETQEEFAIDLFSNGLPDNVKRTAQGGSDAWDTEKYFNLWVCKIQPITIGPVTIGQVLGYAYPPMDLAHWPAGVNAPSPDVEGVVVDYRTIGRNNPFEIDPGTGSPLETKGRTATHEVGHYLGLRHIWGDGGNPLGGGDSCGADDGVEDTPNTAGQSEYDCDTTRNTCNDGMNDLPDMIENFMDYSAETCQNSFTQGQIDIVRGVLENQRCALVNACIETGVRQYDLSSALTVFPNPAQNELYLDLRSSFDYSNFSVQITALNGKVLYQQNTLSSSKIDLPPLENGIYILQLDSPKGRMVKKFSVLR